MFVEIEIPTASLVADTAWMGISRGLTQLARPSSEFAPDTEGTDVFFFCEWRYCRVAPVQPEDPEPSSGRPIAGHSQTAPPPPPDRLHPGHWETDCVLTTSAPERQTRPTRLSHRWKTMVCGEMVSKEVTIILRSEPHFLGVDGACQGQSVRNGLLNIDPNFTADEWLEHMNFGSKRVRFETCWHKHADDTPAYNRAIQGALLETNCEPRVLQTHDRKSARMDECNLSFMLPAVPRQTSVEWFDRRRNRQESRQRNMLLLSRAPAKKQNGTRSEELAATALLFVHNEWHTDTIREHDLVKAQDMGPQFHQTFSFAVVHFGDIPAECIASVVGHDQTILFERPSQVAWHAQAIQGDFRASGDRLLDQDQHQKRLDIMGGCVNSIFTILQQRRANARWNCTLSKETLTSPSSRSSTR